MKIKRTAMFGYLLVSFITTIFIVIILNRISYWNPNLFLFFISFYVFEAIIIFDYSKRESFFSFGILFNVFGCLYTNYYIAELLMLNESIGSNIFKAMRLSYLSIVAFNIGYYILKDIHVDNNTCQNGAVQKYYITYDIRRIEVLLTLFFVVSLATEFFVIFKRIGLNNFFFATRAEKSLLIADYSILTFYQSTIPLIAAIALFIRLEYKTAYSFFLFSVSIVIAVFNAYIRGSRAELICIILPIMYLLSYYKKISNRMVFILGIGTVLLFGIWKSFYSTTRSISFDSEFNTWYKICDNVLGYGFDYLYGKSYLSTICNMIVPVTDTTTLSTWYLQNYEPSVLARGGGRGFSAALEAYINFDFLGNIFIYMFYGVLLSKIEVDECVHRHTGFTYKRIIIFIIMSSIYLFFRAESYSLWKNMVWFKVYPTAIIFLVSRIRKILD